MRIRDLAVVSALAVLAAACETTPSSTDDSSLNAGGANGLDAQGYPLGSQEDLSVTAGDRVFYGFDRYDVTTEGSSTVARQADWLRQYPNVTITISGHCDARGTEEYNLGLGMRRAEEHKKSLIAAGIDANRIAVISYGKAQTIVEGSTEEAYAQNRVTIVSLN